MKKFILIVLVVILSKLSFVCADIPGKGGSTSGTSTFRPVPAENISLNYLKDLAGKIIYRDVPAQNETEFSKEYMNEPYELFSYSEGVMELKNSDKKSIILNRNLWNDGNWKEWAAKNTKNRLEVGDMVKTTKKYNEIFNVSSPVIIGRIIDITVVLHPGNEVATLDSGKILDTDWLEKYDTETTNKWYVGQKVWDVLKGRGIVVCTSVIEKDFAVKINVKFDNNLFGDWHDIDTYTLSGKYKENQAQRLFPIETKSVIFYLDKLFPKK